MPVDSPPIVRSAARLLGRSVLWAQVLTICACAFWGISDDPLLGSMVIEETRARLAASGDVCYLRFADQIQVVDASDAASPAVSGSIPLAGEVDYGTAFCVSGGILLSGNDLYDISEPHAPRLVGTIDVGGATLGTAVLRPPCLYAMAQGAPGADRTFSIVELSDPAHPAVAGSKEVTSSYLWVDGDRAFVYTDCYEELDTSDPASLRTVSRHDKSDPPPQSVTRGSHTFEPGGKTSLLRVWDRSVPEAPVEVATLRIAELVNSYAAYLAGDTLVLISQSRLVPSLQQIWAVHVSDPVHPGAPRRIDAGISSFSSVAHTNRRVYATGMECIFGSRLLLYVMVLP